ncbi:receptor protein [Salix suchowensis]|nr:receptor protein [Salix suchowensis]
MNSSVFSFLSDFVFLLLLFIQIPSSLSNDDLFSACRKEFVCGVISAGFPFWGADRPPACGIPELEIKCENNCAKMNISQVAYRVLEINREFKTLRIAREDYLAGLCPPQFMNSTFNPKVFESDEGNRNFTLIYGCEDAPITIPVPRTFNWKINDVYGQSGYIKEGEDGPGECNGSVIVPVPILYFPPGWNTSVSEWKVETFEGQLKTGFEVRWKVNMDLCGEWSTSRGVCGIYNPIILSSSESKASSSIAATMIVTSSIIIICLTRKKGSFRAVIAMAFRQMNSQHVDSVETFMMDYHSLTPKRFSYSDIKKMTNSFVYTLGHGGFGNVYRGKLPDGRLVAVKVLKESKGDGEEFINEVASISRTSHVNVVTLLGFCYERNKRALIYEFMPNGSLDSFISDKDTNCRLEWKKLYEIAVSIARGLEYLHRGCNTPIVHFDIKPHNILLDGDFNPKISDFGLAKLCKSKVSKISMIGARGTVGYIAPEVFCRSFGPVTYKSDVYSYGMMVLEMMYFPDWFYMYLEPGEISTLHGGIMEEEEEIVKKMILVGLWCIQTIPSHRPSMTKVVEMFEGSLQSLQIPPRPSLNSPRKIAQELYSSTASSLPCESSQEGRVYKLSAEEGDLSLEIANFI